MQQLTRYHFFLDRSIAEFECFHNHVLMFARKRFSFSPAVNEAGIVLTTMTTEGVMDPQKEKDVFRTWTESRRPTSPQSSPPSTSELLETRVSRETYSTWRIITA
ncbi:hypothetical protein JOB18_022734, partial [Solea senegalensis]